MMSTANEKFRNENWMKNARRKRDPGGIQGPLERDPGESQDRNS